MFVTVFYAVFDPANRQFVYANGGHNSPLIVNADGQATRLPLTGGIALAMLPDIEYGYNSVTLAPGDTVVLYTDGVTEAINDVEEEFGMQRLHNVFAGAPPQDAREANDAVFEAVRGFVGDTPQFDDITCVTFRYRGAEA